MSKEDLIPIKTTARAKELGRKGGLVRSEKKVLAARLREMKKKMGNSDTYRKIVEAFQNRKISDLDRYIFLKSWESRATSVKEAMAVDRQMSDWQEKHFGPTKLIQNNTQINIVQMIDEAVDRANKVLEKENIK